MLVTPQCFWWLFYIETMFSPIFFEFEEFLKILLIRPNIPLCSVGTQHDKWKLLFQFKILEYLDTFFLNFLIFYCSVFEKC